jgi:arylsulfatase A-like enzyme
MNRLTFCLLAVTLFFACPASAIVHAAPAQKPNVIWVVVEDMSAHFGCYGETTIETPNVDKLAAEGAKFTQAFVTAPVCSTCRSAMVTGMYQTSIGAHHHRSGRGTEKIHLPEHVQLIPKLFQEAGYFTANGYNVGPKKPPRKGKPRIGKTDYNFEWDESVYDSNDFRDRKPGQPFFAQIQLKGGKGRTKNTPAPVDPADVVLPPYYPDDPLIRDDWAQYLNSVMNTDIEVGKLMDLLREVGVADNTYVFFMTDHGISHGRGKQFVYEEGMRIPLIVWGPGIEAGTVRDDLVVHIDMAATSLEMAGIEIPEYMQGRPLFGRKAKPREYVVSARDRCDETVDRIRGLRTDRFKYIRNFYPARPYLQPCAYKDKKPILKTLRKLHAEGKLNRDQMLIMAPFRPEEELFDLQADPRELNNLAANPAYRETLVELRDKLNEWVAETGDQGQEPESATMYDSDMKVYVDGIRRKGGEWVDHAAVIEANIAQMKAWAAEGK